MSHSHSHGPAGRAGARHRSRLVAAFALTLGFFVVEVVVGVASGSLAVLSDAGHMLTDVLGLGMALAAIQLADRAGAHPSRTFGLYRLEILAALANAVLLFGVAGWVLWEAFQRLGDPPDVPSGPVLAVALVGLAVNAVSFALLREGAGESINVRAAYLEVTADALGSVGVLVAAVVLAVSDWAYIDPLIGAAIGLFILPRTWTLGGQALRILVQAAPPGLDLDAVEGDLAGLAGVVGVHDLHVWTLTSEMEVASVHLVVAAGTETHGVLDDARALLQTRYEIDHATLQIEPDTHEGCEEVGW